MGQMMWRTLLGEAGPGEHITHYYRDRSFLHDALGIWLAAPLRQNGGAVALTTPENWELINTAIRAQGLTSDRLVKQGRLVRLDVDDFLERFLESGRPAHDVFLDMMEPAIEGLREVNGEGQIRAWGEAVEILRQRGETGAAMDLEEMWNQAVERHGFSLLCSYNVDNLEPSTHRQEMIRLTQAHSVLVPEKDYARLNHAVDRALVDIFGDDGACTLWAKMWQEGIFRSHMPTGQTVLSFFGQHRPAEAESLFGRVKRYFTPEPQIATTA